MPFIDTTNRNCAVLD